MRRLVIATVVIALTLAGCGQPSIPRAISRDLRADVAAIRTAVEAGNVVLAERRLDALATTVGRLLERGRLDDIAALDILESADAVRALLALAPDSSPTVAETTTPSPSFEDEGDEGDGEGKSHGKDKGKGHGDEGHGKDD